MQTHVTCRHESDVSLDIFGIFGIPENMGIAVRPGGAGNPLNRQKMDKQFRLRETHPA
jgi:hypothetical protein